MRFLVTLIGVGGVLSVVSASFIFRAPEHDSAIVHSERFGGNFAYSTVEGHAYRTVSPIISNIIRPVGVTYTVPVHYGGVQHPYLIQGPFYPQFIPQGDTETFDETDIQESDSEPQINQEEQTDNNNESVSIESA